MGKRVADITSRVQEMATAPIPRGPARRLLWLWAINIVLALGALSLGIYTGSWFSMVCGTFSVAVSIMGIVLSARRLAAIRHIDEATARMRAELLAVGVHLD